MTPERKAWWDSLPREEKEIRLAIAWQESELHDCKALLNGSKFVFLTPLEAWQTIKNSKQTIKALRKQIAMRPITVRVGNIDFICCPKCKHEVSEPCCEQCGQKLRWD